MKPKFLLLTLFIIGSMAAFSQTTPATKEKLQQVKADPKTKDRAAKADAHVVKQNVVIADTTTKASTSSNAPASKKNSKKKSK